MKLSGYRSGNIIILKNYHILKFMKPALRRRCLLILLLVLTSLGNSRAEEAGELESVVDALEIRLEMGRHEQLAARKKLPESVLAEFTTDGCSGGLSVGWQYLAGKNEYFKTTHNEHPPWESCCIKHDQLYHTGGSREAAAAKSFDARKEADLALRDCVVETGVQRAPELSAEYNVSTQEIAILYTAISNLMYRAVRLGGMPCTGLPWRWGYGWPECQ
jgi:hypothetical protein